MRIIFQWHPEDLEGWQQAIRISDKHPNAVMVQETTYSRPVQKVLILMERSLTPAASPAKE